jgi:hypothetical protein
LPTGAGFGRDRFELRTLFAAKIAAAFLYARKEDIAAIVAALRAEENAMVGALAKRTKSRAQITWTKAAEAVTRERRGHLPSRMRRRPSFRNTPTREQR